MAELISKIVRAANPLNTTPGATLVERGQSISTNPAQDTPTWIKDSGYTSTYKNKEIDSGEQGLRLSGADYHTAIRPDMPATPIDQDRNGDDS